jgi:beta-lactamase regulating signal transducer with metallopeptidase domain/predicted  nucleic acid-binding Zn-ribbon protein
MTDLLIRATILLVGALATSALLRRSSGAVRHAFWSVTLPALVALPVLMALGPRIPVPIPFPVVSGEVAGGALAAGVGDAPVPRPGDDIPAVDAAAGALARLDVSAQAPDGSGAPVAPPVATTATGSAPPPSRLPPTSTLVLLLWASGGLVVAGGVLVGLWRTHGVMGRARPAGEDAWRAALERARRQVGLARPVALRFSPEVSTAMTGGIRRPVVLLPEGADSWSAERRDLVLAHELVHVKRHDPARLLAGRVATALYWFNPLMWLAARLSGLAREQACDEAVIAQGYRPSSYARHLIELAEPATLPIPALAILERPQLEERLMAILRPTSRSRPRTALLAALLAAFWAVTAAGAAPVEIAEPADAVAQEADGPVTGGAVAAGSEAARPVAAGSAVGSAEAGDPLVGGAAAASPAADGPEPDDPVTGAPPARASVAGAALLQERRSCWVDGSSGTFDGTFSTTRSESGERITERYGISDGDRVIQTRIEGMPVCLRAHGPVEFGEGDASIASIGTGGWVVLAARSGDHLLELEMLPGDDDFAHRWFIDGSRQETFGTAEREWRDAMLQALGDRWQIARLRARASTLRGQISTIRGQESTLRGQISTTRGHVSSLSGQISTIRGQESTLRGQISSIRGQESSLRGQISSLNAQISSLGSARRATENDETRARLDAEIRELEAHIANLEREIEAFDAEARAAEVARQLDVEGTSRRIRELEAEIEAYGAAVRVSETERRIVELEVDRRVQAIEAEIAELDVERRVERHEAAVDAHAEALMTATARLLRAPSR